MTRSGAKKIAQHRWSSLWDRLPIAGRLLVTASAALLVAGAAMLWVSANQDAADSQKDLQAELAKELETLPAALAELVVVGDFATLQQTLDRYVARAAVARAGFRDITGIELESRDKPVAPLAPAWFAAVFGFADVNGDTPVIVGGRAYGQLSLTLTSQGQANRAWHRLLHQLSILLLAIGLDFLGIWWLLWAGFKPLARLEAGAGALAAGAYDTRLAPAGGPELRHLIEAFNRMAESIQQSRARLRESEAYNKVLFTGSHIPLVVLDPADGRFIDCNQAAADIYRLGRREAVLGLTPLDVSAPIQYDGGDSAAAAARHIQQANERQSHVFEWRHRRPDGEIWDAEVHLMTIRLGGRALMQFALQDITERRRAEAALMAREQHLRTLIASMDDVVVLIDTAGRIVDFHWPAATGYPRPEPERFLGRDYGEAFPAEAGKAIGEAIAGLVADQQPRRVELVLELGGEARHFQATFSAISDGSARPQGFLGVARDVTESRQREAHSQLLVAALEAAANGILITDRDSVIEWVNPAFSALTGFSREEAVGHKPAQLVKSGLQSREFYQALWTTIMSGEVWQGELVNKRKDGLLYHEELTITPVRDGGVIRHFIAIKQDITARKALEDDLRRLATTDTLTGIANRRHFMERLELELERIRRFGRPAALLMLDLDHFKAVNDTYGHAVGDAVLRHVTAIGQRRLRRIDLFGRLGGEEFAILLPGTERAGALEFADAFRRQLESHPAPSDKGPIAITVSIGIADVDPADARADAILQRADDALYQAKQKGRNRIEVAAA